MNAESSQPNPVVKRTWELRFGFCIVSEKVDAHLRGYNKVAEAEIERRFGRDCLAKAADEAQAVYEPKTEAR